jgi:hypothetical protein
MVNSFYPKFKQSLLTEADANKSLDQTGSNAPYAALVVIAGGYVYSAAHQFYTSLTNIAGTDMPILTPTVVNGLFDGADCTFANVAAGPTIGAIVLYRKNAGLNTTWRLVAYEDSGAAGMPITPNGGSINVVWAGAGIAQL